jgi:hypothetical protein
MHIHYVLCCATPHITACAYIKVIDTYLWTPFNRIIHLFMILSLDRPGQMPLLSSRLVLFLDRASESPAPREIQYGTSMS